MPDEEVLFRTGVTVGAQRSLTDAGLLALGTYPPQHLPGCVIHASITPGPDVPAGTQALDSQRFDGPVPQMLDDAAAWVARSTTPCATCADAGSWSWTAGAASAPAPTGHRPRGEPPAPFVAGPAGPG